MMILIFPPTVYSDVDDGYGPSPNNLDLEPQEPTTPYPDAVNATILGCQEPVTTALSTYIRAWGEWSFAQIYIESMLVSEIKDFLGCAFGFACLC